MLKPSVFLASLFSSLLLTANAETFKAPLVNQSLLLDAYSNGHNIVVGERGHVIIDSQGSGNFSQADVPMAVTLTSVDAVGDKIWVAGHDATIMYSPDGGTTWSVQMHQPELERPFLDILFLNESEGIAVGAYGLFYRTIDGGNTWTAEQHATLLNPLDIEYLEEIRAEDEAFYLEELNSILPHINRVVQVNDDLYAAGETGLLAKSTDFGRSWQRTELDYFGSFFDVAPLSDGVMIAVGLRGAIYAYDSADTLQTWNRIESCTVSTLNSVMLKDADNALVVGNNGAVLSINLPQLKGAMNGECGNNGISVSQIPSKSAIATLINVNDGYTAVTSDGLQQLEVE